MKDEHCAKSGCADDFETSNYGVRTNPRKEYEIATGQRACPAEDMLDKKGTKVRVVKRIEELKLLKMARKAGLTEDEILAVVRPPPAYLNIPRSYPCFKLSCLLFSLSRRRFRCRIHLTASVCLQVLYTGPMFEVPHPPPPRCHAPLPRNHRRHHSHPTQRFALSRIFPHHRCNSRLRPAALFSEPLHISIA